MTAALEGRRHVPTLTAPAADDGDRVLVRAPGVGLWRPLVAAGQAVRADDVIGELTVLGVVHQVRAGAGARGATVTVTGAGRARTPVDHGAVLYALDPHAGVAATSERDAEAAAAAEGLALRAPSSGRFYSRPAPGKPAFVAAGDIVHVGQTVCMLEVMKTFNRVTYGGGGLPDRARVTAIAVADESDVEPGTVLLRLEPV
ncbi:MAG TPA: biotin/lipoyl-containing protein [Kofleriaceae bacterium]|nr:biotin/lipoyl-containing protein [Kofleriaceae bacterium]